MRKINTVFARLAVVVLLAGIPFAATAQEATVQPDAIETATHQIDQPVAYLDHGKNISQRRLRNLARMMEREGISTEARATNEDNSCVSVKIGNVEIGKYQQDEAVYATYAAATYLAGNKLYSGERGNCGWTIVSDTHQNEDTNENIIVILKYGENIDPEQVDFVVLSLAYANVPAQAVPGGSNANCVELQVREETIGAYKEEELERKLGFAALRAFRQKKVPITYRGNCDD